MQIKATMSFHLSWLTGKHQKIKITSKIAGSGVPLLLGMLTVPFFLENNIDISQKTGIDLSLNPAIPLLGMYPKVPKSIWIKDICISMFLAALFTIYKI